jgi:hypothetical protein
VWWTAITNGCDCGAAPSSGLDTFDGDADDDGEDDADGDVPELSPVPAGGQAVDDGAGDGPDGPAVSAAVHAASASATRNVAQVRETRAPTTIPRP